MVHRVLFVVIKEFWKQVIYHQKINFFEICVCTIKLSDYIFVLNIKTKHIYALNQKQTKKEPLFFSTKMDGNAATVLGFPKNTVLNL